MKEDDCRAVATDGSDLPSVLEGPSGFEHG